jgi:hypothetical protein
MKLVPLPVYFVHAPKFVLGDGECKTVSVDCIGNILFTAYFYIYLLFLLLHGRSKTPIFRSQSDDALPTLCHEDSWYPSAVTSLCRTVCVKRHQSCRGWRHTGLVGSVCVCLTFIGSVVLFIPCRTQVSLPLKLTGRRVSRIAMDYWDFKTKTSSSEVTCSVKWRQI